MIERLGGIHSNGHHLAVYFIDGMVELETGSESIWIVDPIDLKQLRLALQKAERRLAQ